MNTGILQNKSARNHPDCEGCLLHCGFENPKKLYLLYIVACLVIVLCFASFQHLVMLKIPYDQLTPSMVTAPLVLGTLFGFLLCKVHLLLLRSRCQVSMILERDRLLKITNDELKTFAYSVSHDLRSPLRAVSGFSALLSESTEGQLNDEGQNCIARIQSGCQRMGDMIENLLLLSKVTQGDVVVEIVDLSQIATNILDELSAQHPGHTVTIDVEPGLTAQADPRLMTIVLDNLINNAWKFSSKNATPKITIECSRYHNKDMFCVRDNGVGFDMRYAKDLFTPFNRLHHETDFAGNGIGLATVQRALTRQGWDIFAHSEINKGSGFYFCAPHSGY